MTVPDLAELAAENDRPRWPLSESDVANAQDMYLRLMGMDAATGGWEAKADCRMTGISYHATFLRPVDDIKMTMQVMNTLGEAPWVLLTAMDLLLQAAKEHNDRVVLRESLDRVVHNLEQFMSDHPDPGTEAIGAVYEAKALLGKAEPQTEPGHHPEFGIVYRRRWTPSRLNPNGSRTFTVKRSCDRCGKLIGDTTEAEIEASIDGDLPDVHDECPFCNP